MKKRFSLILTVIIILNSFSGICRAAQTDTNNRSLYVNDDYCEYVYTMYYKFMSGSSWNDYLTDDKNFVFPQVKDQLKNNIYFQFCLSVTEFLTNAEWGSLFVGE